MPKIVLITGASSGIGKATALELLRAGHTVYGAARRIESMEALTAAGGHVIAADVTKEADLEQLVQAVFSKQGRIDVLINCAGFGLYGAAEDVPLADARYQLDVNLLGPARLIQLVLPHMRSQGTGTIINVSSMGGEIAFPLGAWYHASKHAVEGYTDSLRQEVSGLGINVVLIQPGMIKTEFGGVTSHGVLDHSGQGAYEDMAKALAKATDAMYTQNRHVSDPSVVAKTIRKAAESNHPKTRYPVGYMARPLLTLNWLLPDRLFDKVATSQLH
jgi:NAD(P)-dependent dehydrogenase (short-subunit alcohol dehydrogenase family)